MDVGKNAWSSWYSKNEETIDEEMPRIADFFRSKGISKILDLGCGTGRHTIYFSEKGFEVYGFDLSLYAVKCAKERLKEKGLTANLAVVDMRKKFPYRDETFEAVVSVRVIHHAFLQIIERSVAEVERTLRKGGFFYIDVPSAPRNLKYDRPQQIVGPGTRIPLDGPEKGLIHHDFTEEEIRKLLRNFEIEEILKKGSHLHILARRKD